MAHSCNRSRRSFRTPLRSGVHQSDTIARANALQAALDGLPKPEGTNRLIRVANVRTDYAGMFTPGDYVTDSPAFMSASSLNAYAEAAVTEGRTDGCSGRAPFSESRKSRWRFPGMRRGHAASAYVDRGTSHHAHLCKEYLHGEAAIGLSAGMNRSGHRASRRVPGHGLARASLHLA